MVWEIASAAVSQKEALEDFLADDFEPFAVVPDGMEIVIYLRKQRAWYSGMTGDEILESEMRYWSRR